ncbi:lanosterol synthase-like isoform X2 [Paramacrobiotus metropolitanus]|nr:lanosterol synthase-like isoform X2 [Paramacrobiotus metropolitanus]
MTFYANLQAEDGHWPSDYSGPLFLIPVLLIACYVTNTSISDAQRKEMVRYLRSAQRVDGGWGLYIEGPGTVFGTTFNYCAMRILGIGGNDPDLVRARKYLHRLGGALTIPSWGKFWLSVLNVYDYDGMHSIFPEMWLLPEWVPIHPSKLWCHCRQVYLPMGYCYGRRLKAAETDLVRQLRQELYVEDYSTIQWKAHRDNVSPADLYTPHSWLLKLAYVFLDYYEKWHIPFIREKALGRCYDNICADDEFTNFINIGAVTKGLNMLVRWSVDGPQHPAFQMHQERISDYLWLGSNGMRVNGTDGSQLWDTVFSVQAFLEAGAAKDTAFLPVLRRAYEFIKSSQIREDPPNYTVYYRQSCKYGWTFTTRDGGWMTPDCTAEAVKSLLCLEHGPESIEPIPVERLHGSVNLLISLQNKSGGFSSYEKQRGGHLLELLNPSEIFGDIMIDYSYIECTSAVLQAVNLYQKTYPTYRASEIREIMHRGLNFIRREQREDGSWEGRWGVCFTYGTWWALEALACMGYHYNTVNQSESVRKACSFLKNYQNDDGGWGEDFESCKQRRYIRSPTSHVISTCWALLGLMAVQYPEVSIVEKGIRFIVSRQLENGDWPQEAVSGVFNKSCAINYANYRNIFPIWTLGRFIARYGQNFLYYT